jgi:hypothetical protein
LIEDRCGREEEEEIGIEDEMMKNRIEEKMGGRIE